MVARRFRRIFAGLALWVAAGCGGEIEQSVLNPKGVEAERIATLWWVMFGLGALVWVAVVAALLYALLLARRTPAAERPEADARKTRVVGGAVGVSLLILVGTFLASLFTGRNSAATDDPEVLAIEVIGRRFWWEVRYPGAAPGEAVTTANEIHLPVNRPVLIEVRTADVIHSFWTPNLHGKIDMIPGRTNRIWVRAEETGVFRGQCAEFCGVQHAHMGFVVVVEPEEEFAAWLAHQRLPAVEPADSLAERGRRVFVNAACADCHAIRGTPASGNFGPELTHLASRRSLAAAILPNTRGHLGGWIANPQRIKPGNNMPHVPLPSEEFHALLHYLLTLK
jgi:cytochrome c oxidase subunit 2